MQRTHLARHLAVPVEMIRRPRHIVPWIRDRISGQSPSIQGMPWIAMPCIDFLESHLVRGARVLEWGGGGSTMYFLKKGCLLTTVESSEVWVKELTSRVKDLGGEEPLSRWDLRVVPAKGNEDPLISRYIDQVNQGGPWDVVLVDGWSRFRCFMEARQAVLPNGVLILDNADQDQFKQVPGLMQGWAHREFRGLGVARSWVTQTDVYIRPS